MDLLMRMVLVVAAVAGRVRNLLAVEGCKRARFQMLSRRDGGGRNPLWCYVWSSALGYLSVVCCY